ncbi:hypothetical protein KY332_01510 [Candidatus Woesearchaeota archaeon]|nr:hypothetical protein [Candidatus Woesearchaeota archaeon]
MNLQEYLKIDPIYKEGVNRLISLSSGRVFSNIKPENILALYQTLFRHAVDNMIIFNEHENSELLDSPLILDSVKSAVARGVSIDVLLKQEEDTEFISLLKEYNMSPSYTVPRHLGLSFAVIDSKAYRVQKGDEYAFACMNNPKYARKLEDIFFSIKYKSKP